MTGIHFFHGDYGRGGKGGFVHVVNKWCVVTPQGKKHITKETIDRTEYGMTDCDGSCERKQEMLPVDIADIAKTVKETDSRNEVKKQ